ncbi:hypothetical protein CXG81DRAFT_17130 [Caulochytrium protostelioides]|uniref:Uncharacterized protein n=1 Tax=Caulochytrium protostelioides TaxID=1555241 RepID=A0A4P9XCV0_9FUNG|nr:hypothetical protein CXG81DRAFT_17130 [Caulochytrium protostelioides]|eukprot:RKP03273.1 hypothetical protein CXG81DRAFT_17130 [Caulochytrium protostelioides]
MPIPPAAAAAAAPVPVPAPAPAPSSSRPYAPGTAVRPAGSPGSSPSKLPRAADRPAAIKKGYGSYVSESARRWATLRKQVAQGFFRALLQQGTRQTDVSSLVRVLWQHAHANWQRVHVARGETVVPISRADPDDAATAESRPARIDDVAGADAANPDGDIWEFKKVDHSNRSSVAMPGQREALSRTTSRFSIRNLSTTGAGVPLGQRSVLERSITSLDRPSNPISGPVPIYLDGLTRINVNLCIHRIAESFIKSQHYDYLSMTALGQIANQGWYIFIAAARRSDPVDRWVALRAIHTALPSLVNLPVEAGIREEALQAITTIALSDEVASLRRIAASLVAGMVNDLRLAPEHAPILKKTFYIFLSHVLEHVRYAIDHTRQTGTGSRANFPSEHRGMHSPKRGSMVSTSLPEDYESATIDPLSSTSPLSSENAAYVRATALPVASGPLPLLDLAQPLQLCGKFLRIKDKRLREKFEAIMTLCLHEILHHHPDMAGPGRDAAKLARRASLIAASSVTSKANVPVNPVAVLVARSKPVWQVVMNILNVDFEVSNRVSQHMAKLLGTYIQPFIHFPDDPQLQQDAIQFLARWFPIARDVAMVAGLNELRAGIRGLAEVPAIHQFLAPQWMDERVSGITEALDEVRHRLAIHAFFKHRVLAHPGTLADTAPVPGCPHFFLDPVCSMHFTRRVLLCLPIPAESRVTLTRALPGIPGVPSHCITCPPVFTHKLAAATMDLHGSHADFASSEGTPRSRYELLVKAGRLPGLPFGCTYSPQPLVDVQKLVPQEWSAGAGGGPPMGASTMSSRMLGTSVMDSMLIGTEDSSHSGNGGAPHERTRYGRYLRERGPIPPNTSRMPPSDLNENLVDESGVPYGYIKIPHGSDMTELNAYITRSGNGGAFGDLLNEMSPIYHVPIRQVYQHRQNLISLLVANGGKEHAESAHSLGRFGSQTSFAETNVATFAAAAAAQEDYPPGTTTERYTALWPSKSPLAHIAPTTDFPVNSVLHLNILVPGAPTMRRYALVVKAVGQDISAVSVEPSRMTSKDRLDAMREAGVGSQFGRSHRDPDGHTEDEMPSDVPDIDSADAFTTSNGADGLYVGATFNFFIQVAQPISNAWIPVTVEITDDHVEDEFAVLKKPEPAASRRFPGVVGRKGGFGPANAGSTGGHDGSTAARPSGQAPPVHVTMVPAGITQHKMPYFAPPITLLPLPIGFLPDGRVYYGRTESLKRAPLGQTIYGTMFYAASDVPGFAAALGRSAPPGSQAQVSHPYESSASLLGGGRPTSNMLAGYDRFGNPFFLSAGYFIPKPTGYTPDGVPYWDVRTVFEQPRGTLAVPPDLEDLARWPQFADEMDDDLIDLGDHTLYRPSVSSLNDSSMVSVSMVSSSWASSSMAPAGSRRTGGGFRTKGSRKGHGGGGRGRHGAHPGQAEATRLVQALQETLPNLAKAFLRTESELPPPMLLRHRKPVESLASSVSTSLSAVSNMGPFAGSASYAAPTKWWAVDPESLAQNVSGYDMKIAIEPTRVHCSSMTQHITKSVVLTYRSARGQNGERDYYVSTTDPAFVIAPGSSHLMLQGEGLLEVTFQFHPEKMQGTDALEGMLCVTDVDGNKMATCVLVGERQRRLRCDQSQVNGGWLLPGQTKQIRLSLHCLPVASAAHAATLGTMPNPSMAVPVTLSIRHDASGAFGVTQTQMKLQPSETKLVPLVFKPQTRGPATATLEIQGPNGEVIAVALAGMAGVPLVLHAETSQVSHEKGVTVLTRERSDFLRSLTLKPNWSLGGASSLSAAPPHVGTAGDPEPRSSTGAPQPTQAAETVILRSIFLAQAQETIVNFGVIPHGARVPCCVTLLNLAESSQTVRLYSTDAPDRLSFPELVRVASHRANTIEVVINTTAFAAQACTFMSTIDVLCPEYGKLTIQVHAFVGTPLVLDVFDIIYMPPCRVGQTSEVQLDLINISKYALDVDVAVTYAPTSTAVAQTTALASPPLTIDVGSEGAIASTPVHLADVEAGDPVWTNPSTLAVSVPPVAEPWAMLPMSLQFTCRRRGPLLAFIHVRTLHGRIPVRTIAAASYGFQPWRRGLHDDDANAVDYFRAWLSHPKRTLQEYPPAKATVLQLQMPLDAAKLLNDAAHETAIAKIRFDPAALTLLEPAAAFQVQSAPGVPTTLGALETGPLPTERSLTIFPSSFLSCDLRSCHLPYAGGVAELNVEFTKTFRYAGWVCALADREAWPFVLPVQCRPAYGFYVFPERESQLADLLASSRGTGANGEPATSIAAIAMSFKGASTQNILLANLQTERQTFTISVIKSTADGVATRCPFDMSPMTGEIARGDIQSVKVTCRPTAEAVSSVVTEVDVHIRSSSDRYAKPRLLTRVRIDAQWSSGELFGIPDALSFGACVVGYSRTQSFTIQNRNAGVPVTLSLLTKSPFSIYVELVTARRGYETSHASLLSSSSDQLALRAAAGGETAPGRSPASASAAAAVAELAAAVPAPTTLQATLQPGESLRVHVHFTPVESRSVLGKCYVYAADCDYTVNLVGTGGIADLVAHRSHRAIRSVAVGKTLAGLVAPPPPGEDAAGAMSVQTQEVLDFELSREGTIRYLTVYLTNKGTLPLRLHMITSTQNKLVRLYYCRMTQVLPYVTEMHTGRDYWAILRRKLRVLVSLKRIIQSHHVSERGQSDMERTEGALVPVGDLPPGTRGHADVRKYTLQETIPDLPPRTSWQFNIGYVARYPSRRFFPLRFHYSADVGDLAGLNAPPPVKVFSFMMGGPVYRPVEFSPPFWDFGLVPAGISQHGESYRSAGYDMMHQTLPGMGTAELMHTGPPGLGGRGLPGVGGAYPRAHGAMGASTLLLDIANLSIEPQTVSLINTSPEFTIDARHWQLSAGQKITVPIAFRPSKPQMQYRGHATFAHQHGEQVIKLNGIGGSAEVVADELLDFGSIKSKATSMATFKMANRGLLGCKYFIELVCPSDGGDFVVDPEFIENQQVEDTRRVSDGPATEVVGFLDAGASIEIPVLSKCVTSPSGLSFLVLRWSKIPGGMLQEVRVPMYIEVGIPRLVPSTLELDFSTTFLQAIKYARFKITNDGTATCLFRIVWEHPNITIEPNSVGQLEPGERQTISVRFQPTTFEPLTIPIEIDSDAGVAHIMAYGIVGLPSLEFPKDYQLTDFGITPVGHIVSRDIVIKNMSPQAIVFDTTVVSCADGVLIPKTEFDVFSVTPATDTIPVEGHVTLKIGCKPRVFNVTYTAEVMLRTREGESYGFSVSAVGGKAIVRISLPAAAGLGAPTTPTTPSAALVDGHGPGHRIALPTKILSTSLIDFNAAARLPMARPELVSVAQNRPKRDLLALKAQAEALQDILQEIQTATMGQFGGLRDHQHRRISISRVRRLSGVDLPEQMVPGAARHGPSARDARHHASAAPLRRIQDRLAEVSESRYLDEDVDLDEAQTHLNADLNQMENELSDDASGSVDGDGGDSGDDERGASGSRRHSLASFSESQEKARGEDDGAADAPVAPVAETPRRMSWQEIREPVQNLLATAMHLMNDDEIEEMAYEALQNDVITHTSELVRDIREQLDTEWSFKRSYFQEALQRLEVSTLSAHHDPVVQLPTIQYSMGLARGADPTASFWLFDLPNTGNMPFDYELVALDASRVVPALTEAVESYTPRDGFTVTPLKGTLPPHSTVEFRSSFVGNIAGVWTQTFQLQSNGEIVTEFRVTVTVGLPKLRIFPEGDIHFGNTIKKTRVQREITVKNEGTYPETWRFGLPVAADSPDSPQGPADAVAAGGDDGAADGHVTFVWVGPSMGKLEPGETVTIPLHFAPPEEGFFSQTFALRWSMEPLLVKVTGTGAGTRLMPTDPQSQAIDFGNACVVGQTYVRTWSLINKGTIDARVRILPPVNPRPGKDGPTQFDLACTTDVDDDGCFAAPIDRVVTVTLAFTPQCRQKLMGHIEFLTSDDRRLPLEIRGFAGVCAWEAKGQADFHNFSIHETQTREITIYNTGDLDLYPTCHVAPADVASAFVISSQGLLASGALKPGAAWVIRFTASAPAMRFLQGDVHVVADFGRGPDDRQELTMPFRFLVYEHALVISDLGDVDLGCHLVGTAPELSRTLINYGHRPLRWRARLVPVPAAVTAASAAPAVNPAVLRGLMASAKAGNTNGANKWVLSGSDEGVLSTEEVTHLTWAFLANTIEAPRPHVVMAIIDVLQEPEADAGAGPPAVSSESMASASPAPPTAAAALNAGATAAAAAVADAFESRDAVAQWKELYRFQLTGSIGLPILVISTPVVDFGTIPLNGYGQATFTLSNEGNATVEFKTKAIQVTQGETDLLPVSLWKLDEFDLSKIPTEGTVAPGETVTCLCTFRPRELVGGRKASLTFHTQNQIRSIDLQATGAEFKLDTSELPNQLDYGGMAFGDSKALSLSLTNGSIFDVTVSLVLVEGAQAETADGTADGAASPSDAPVTEAVAPVAPAAPSYATWQFPRVVKLAANTANTATVIEESVGLKLALPGNLAESQLAAQIERLVAGGLGRATLRLTLDFGVSYLIPISWQYTVQPLALYDAASFGRRASATSSYSNNADGDDDGNHADDGLASTPLSMIDFGDQSMDTSETKAFVLYNPNPWRITVRCSVAEAQFAVTPATVVLPPKEQREVCLDFREYDTSSGSVPPRMLYETTLTIAPTAFAPHVVAPLAIPARGVLLDAPPVPVPLQSMDFGTLFAGRSRVLEGTFANVLRRAQAYKVVMDPSMRDVFQLLTPSRGQVAAKTSVPFRILFTPQQAFHYTMDLSIEAEEYTLTTSLQGDCVQPYVDVVSAFDFGIVAVGYPTDREVVVTNPFQTAMDLSVALVNPVSAPADGPSDYVVFALQQQPPTGRAHPTIHLEPMAACTLVLACDPVVVGAASTAMITLTMQAAAGTAAAGPVDHDVVVGTVRLSCRGGTLGLTALHADGEASDGEPLPLDEESVAAIVAARGGSAAASPLGGAPAGLTRRPPSGIRIVEQTRTSFVYEITFDRVGRNEVISKPLEIENYGDADIAFDLAEQSVAPELNGFTIEPRTFMLHPKSTRRLVVTVTGGQPAECEVRVRYVSCYLRTPLELTVVARITVVDRDHAAWDAAAPRGIDTLLDYMTSENERIVREPFVRVLAPVVRITGAPPADPQHPRIPFVQPDVAATDWSHVLARRPAMPETVAVPARHQPRGRAALRLDHAAAPPASAAGTHDPAAQRKLDASAFLRMMERKINMRLY